MDDRSAGGTIQIWTRAAGPGTGGAKSALPSFAGSTIQVSEIRLSQLTASLGTFLSDVQKAVDEADQAASMAFIVDEIELSLGVSASGGLALIGKMEAGVEASMKIKLKRRSA